MTATGTRSCSGDWPTISQVVPPLPEDAEREMGFNGGVDDRNLNWSS